MRCTTPKLRVLVSFARYTSHLLSELSFFTTWDETVHMAASHGVSVIRLPPTKITAVISKTEIMHLDVKMVEAQDDSIIFHHSSKPFTSQHSIFDSTTATRKSSSVIHAKRTTQVRGKVLDGVTFNNQMFIFLLSYGSRIFNVTFTNVTK